MALLRIEVDNGETIILVDDAPITGIIWNFVLEAEANNQGDDKIKVKFAGIVQGMTINSVISDTCEIKIVIPDLLGDLLKPV